MVFFTKFRTYSSSTHFKGPDVLDKATHPTIPKVQNTSTKNTPSPIPATKAMLYKTQNSLFTTDLSSSCRHIGFKKMRHVSYRIMSHYFFRFSGCIMGRLRIKYTATLPSPNQDDIPRFMNRKIMILLVTRPSWVFKKLGFEKKKRNGLSPVKWWGRGEGRGSGGENPGSKGGGKSTGDGRREGGKWDSQGGNW